VREADNRALIQQGCLTQSMDISDASGSDVQGSVPGRGKVFLSSSLSKSALGHTQPPIHSIPVRGSFPGGNEEEA
jgi:hypothetical protein